MQTHVLRVMHTHWQIDEGIIRTTFSRKQICLGKVYITKINIEKIEKKPEKYVDKNRMNISQCKLNTDIKVT